MTTLVFIECQEHEKEPTILNASIACINAAKELNQPIHAIIDNQDIAQQLSTIDGVENVIISNMLPYGDPQIFAETLYGYMADNTYTHLLAAATGVGKNMLPRVAGLLDVMQVSEVTNIIDTETFEHCIYAGSVIETVKDTQDKHILTIRATHFSSEVEMQPACKIEDHTAIIDVEFDDLNRYGRVSIDNHSNTGRPELSTAQVVVAAGGGVANEEQFNTMITPLAEKLGAAIGASKMPIANGFCGADCLVGQTGKTIAPALYLAIGISGANQHVAGMKGAKTIIAINSDEEAPIFKYADYGLVADIKTALPEILSKV